MNISTLATLLLASSAMCIGSIVIRSQYKASQRKDEPDQTARQLWLAMACGSVLLALVALLYGTGYLV